MKTITITLTEQEAELLSALTEHFDPAGGISPTSVAHAALTHGLVRVAIDRKVSLPGGWLEMKATKYYRQAL